MVNDNHPSVTVLGYAPSPDQIERWFSQQGLSQLLIGESVQGRPLYLYSNQNFDIRKKHVLFLSLVHGNEPLGLLSLLWTVELWMARTKGRLRTRFYNERHKDRLGILWFPIVNIDAYTLNLQHGEGCRRTNLRMTCPDDVKVIRSCPHSSRGGVDLNRNHGMDWNGTFADQDTDDPDLGGFCGITYKGTSPWSEPESRAIRNVVKKWKIVSAMSFHTRSTIDADALLIHPFTSARPLSSHPIERLTRYREWSKRLNEKQLYKTGSANETIGYTASGSTIDWMDSQGVISFVLESRSPCDGRWCVGPEVANATQEDGQTGLRLVELTEAICPDVGQGRDVAIFLVVLAIVYLSSRRSRSCPSPSLSWHCRRHLYPERRRE